MQFKKGDKVGYRGIVTLIRPLEPQETICLKDEPVVVKNPLGDKWWVRLSESETNIVACLEGDDSDWELKDGVYYAAKG